MIIECPSCQSKFNLDDGQLTRERVKLRCRICSNVFVFEKSALSNLEQEFENLLTESESAALLDDQPETPGEAASEEPQAESAPDAETVTAELDNLLPQPEELTPLRRSRRALAAGFILALLVTGGAGTYYYFSQRPQPTKPPATQAKVARPVAPSMSIAKGSLNFELLPRENGENVLVIKGKIKRLTSAPVSSVLLEARLSDENGKVIETKEFYAGIVPQKEEFISQSSETIDSLLQAVPTAGAPGISTAEIPFALAIFGASAKQAASAQIEVKQIKWLPAK